MNILITGGASGLGAAVTRVLSAESAHRVWFTFNESACQAKEIEEQYKNSSGLKCNFIDSGDVEQLIEKIEAVDIDVLIHNAMPSMTKNHFHKMGEDIFSDSFKNNVMPVIRITQAAIQIFRKKKFGKIITILSSALINKPPVGWSEYVANKAYLHSMSKSWAVENAAFKITANTISPSFMQTHLTSDTDERVVEGLVCSHPLKKLLTPEEVADAVLFFVNASQHINGTNLIINSAADVI
jgi:3-oxoacyl-[acyl-carrier protein] reductase